MPVRVEAPSVEAPTVEHHRDALGIGTATPRLSWIVETAPPAWVLERTELELRGDDGLRATADIEGDASVLVAWPFAALASATAVEVRLRVFGAGVTSDWSAWTRIETGLLAETDWSVQAIAPHEDASAAAVAPRPASLLRGIFELDDPRPVRRARLYATGHGVFEFEVNGAAVGDDVLAPGWTSYRHRLRYRTYDVTDHLRRGENAIGAWLGDGWYRGRLGFDGGYTNLYGDSTAVLAQLEVTFDDGERLIVGTGPDWVSSPSPITSAGLLEGERYDAREEQHGWSSPGFDAREWRRVLPAGIDLGALVAPEGPPVRCIEEVAPVAVDRRPDGRVIVDFGQNLVGRLRVRPQLPAGAELVIRHAEVLDGDGELYRRPLRGATSEDRYVSAAADAAPWEPRFTIHGFRYAELTGWGDAPIEDHVRARVVHTDMRRTGWFTASDPLLERLHENVVWSMRGNFVDLPTDCPQRDERLGWTGDIQVFAPTAGFLYDCAGLLSSWLRDVAAEQQPDGTIPWYVPEIPGGHQWTPARPGAGWGDAAVLVPSAVHQHTADVELWERQFPSAKAWVDLEARLAGDSHVWDGSYQLGDWLDPSAPPDDPANGSTDPHLIATAYFARSSRALADAAELLEAPVAAALAQRADAARAGFRRRYRTGEGTLSSHSQAAYAIAIVFDLLDPDELAPAGDHLAELVAAEGIHLSTGFLGTPVLLEALSRVGRLDVAMALLQQRSIPSWLYPVLMGATTIWERWDSMLPDGTVNPGDMTSFNHFAFGAVADWMHSRLAGIAPLEPGWRRIRFHPAVDSGLQHAGAEHITPYGRASIRWERTSDGTDVTVVVPVGTTAVLHAPTGTAEHLGSGTHRRHWSTV